MVDHFFREGIPNYDMNDFDKPNDYDSDPETYPELHLITKLNECILCFAHETDKTL
jgi:hypothetical protein